MKALITVLSIVLTSSVALARPITVDHRTDDAVTHDGIMVRDHRDPATFSQPAPQYYRPDSTRYDSTYNQPLRFRLRPVTLANDVSMMRMRNRDHRPLLINVDSRMGTFKSLRLDRDQGRMFVESIVVMMSNGRAQTFTVNQLLSGRSPSITIDIGHRAISGIYVYGSTERGRATFDVIGLRR
ncbi:MAG TPA: hypothetical protein VIV11_10025 [Kofleriaceae bacterium]